MKEFKKIAATPQWFYFIVIHNMLMYLKSVSVLFILVSSIVLSTSSVYGQITVTDGATYVENQFVGESEGFNGKTQSNTLLNSFVEEIIVISVPILVTGIISLFVWLRKKGIEITPNQEKMFKQLMTERYKKLAKTTWQAFREDEKEFSLALNSGKIPSKFAEKLKSEGKEFANELLEKKEFHDFGKNLAKNSVEKILENIRADLKNENQKRMLDVLPRIASIAVDAAFKENQSLEKWGNEALKNIRPLLVNTESLEKESNIMLIINAEINKRLQSKLQIP